MKYVGVDPKTKHKLFKSDFFFKRFGRVQAIRIFDYSKFVAYYISKYITKDEHRIFERRYFVSQGLDKSEEIMKGTYDFDKLESFKNVLPSFENSMCISYEIDDIEILGKLINELGGSK